MFKELPRSVDQNLIGDGNVMAGGLISNSLNGSQSAKSPTGKNQIDLDEKELILKLRDVGGKRTLRKFINELDRIKKLLDDEI